MGRRAPRYQRTTDLHRWYGEISHGRDIYFAIYQAIASDERRPGLYREYAPDFFDLIIIDECHRGSARDDSNWRDILNYFEPAYQLGMTATPLRDDNRDTYAYFGAPLYTGARAVAERHEAWARTLPKESAELWVWIAAQDQETSLSLLAYCAARTVSNVRQPWSNEPQRLAHADALAGAVGLDMAAYWSPTVDNYLGRVTKARILEAVREGVSERNAESLANFKKSDMAGHAERLLADKQWLPDVLRTTSAEAVVSLPAAIAAE